MSRLEFDPFLKSTNARKNLSSGLVEKSQGITHPSVSLEAYMDYESKYSEIIADLVGDKENRDDLKSDSDLPPNFHSTQDFLSPSIGLPRNSRLYLNIPRNISPQFYDSLLNQVRRIHSRIALQADVVKQLQESVDTSSRRAGVIAHLAHLTGFGLAEKSLSTSVNKDGESAGTISSNGGFLFHVRIRRDDPLVLQLGSTSAPHSLQNLLKVTDLDVPAAIVPPILQPVIPVAPSASSSIPVLYNPLQAANVACLDGSYLQSSSRATRMVQVTECFGEIAQETLPFLAGNAAIARQQMLLSLEATAEAQSLLHLEMQSLSQSQMSQLNRASRRRRAADAMAAASSSSSSSQRRGLVPLAALLKSSLQHFYGSADQESTQLGGLNAILGNLKDEAAAARLFIAPPSVGLTDLLDSVPKQADPRYNEDDINKKLPFGGLSLDEALAVLAPSLRVQRGDILVAVDGMRVKSASHCRELAQMHTLSGPSLWQSLPPPLLLHPSTILAALPDLPFYPPLWTFQSSLKSREDCLSLIRRVVTAAKASNYLSSTIIDLDGEGDSTSKSRVSLLRLLDEALLHSSIPTDDSKAMTETDNSSRRSLRRSVVSAGNDLSSANPINSLGQLFTELDHSDEEEHSASLTGNDRVPSLSICFVNNESFLRAYRPLRAAQLVVGAKETADIVDAYIPYHRQIHVESSFDSSEQLDEIKGDVTSPRQDGKKKKPARLRLVLNKEASSDATVLPIHESSPSSPLPLPPPSHRRLAQVSPPSNIDDVDGNSFSWLDSLLNDKMMGLSVNRRGRGLKSRFIREFSAAITRASNHHGSTSTSDRGKEKDAEIKGPEFLIFTVYRPSIDFSHALLSGSPTSSIQSVSTVESGGGGGDATVEEQKLSPEQKELVNQLRAEPFLPLPLPTRIVSASQRNMLESLPESLFSAGTLSKKNADLLLLSSSNPSERRIQGIDSVSGNVADPNLPSQAILNGANGKSRGRPRNSVALAATAGTVSTLESQLTHAHSFQATLTAQYLSTVVLLRLLRPFVRRRADESANGSLRSLSSHQLRLSPSTHRSVSWSTITAALRTVPLLSKSRLACIFPPSFFRPELAGKSVYVPSANGAEEQNPLRFLSSLLCLGSSSILSMIERPFKMGSAPCQLPMVGQRGQLIAADDRHPQTISGITEVEDDVTARNPFLPVSKALAQKALGLRLAQRALSEDVAAAADAFALSLILPGVSTLLELSSSRIGDSEEAHELRSLSLPQAFLDAVARAGDILQVPPPVEILLSLGDSCQDNGDKESLFGSLRTLFQPPHEPETKILDMDVDDSAKVGSKRLRSSYPHHIPNQNEALKRSCRRSLLQSSPRGCVVCEAIAGAPTFWSTSDLRTLHEALKQTEFGLIDPTSGTVSINSLLLAAFGAPSASALTSSVPSSSTTNTVTCTPAHAPLHALATALAAPFLPHSHADRVNAHSEYGHINLSLLISELQKRFQGARVRSAFAQAEALAHAQASLAAILFPSSVSDSPPSLSHFLRFFTSTFGDSHSDPTVNVSISRDTELVGTVGAPGPAEALVMILIVILRLRRSSEGRTQSRSVLTKSLKSWNNLKMKLRGSDEHLAAREGALAALKLVRGALAVDGDSTFSSSFGSFVSSFSPFSPLASVCNPFADDLSAQLGLEIRLPRPMSASLGISSPVGQDSSLLSSPYFSATCGPSLASTLVLKDVNLSVLLQTSVSNGSIDFQEYFQICRSSQSGEMGKQMSKQVSLVPFSLSVIQPGMSMPAAASRRLSSSIMRFLQLRESSMPEALPLRERSPLFASDFLSSPVNSPDMPLSVPLLGASPASMRLRARAGIVLEASAAKKTVEDWSQGVCGSFGVGNALASAAEAAQTLASTLHASRSDISLDKSENMHFEDAVVGDIFPSIPLWLVGDMSVLRSDSTPLFSSTTSDSLMSSKGSTGNKVFCGSSGGLVLGPAGGIGPTGTLATLLGQSQVGLGSGAFISSRSRLIRVRSVHSNPAFSSAPSAFLRPSMAAAYTPARLLLLAHATGGYRLRSFSKLSLSYSSSKAPTSVQQLESAGSDLEVKSDVDMELGWQHPLRGLYLAQVRALAMRALQNPLDGPHMQELSISWDSLRLVHTVRAHSGLAGLQLAQAPSGMLLSGGGDGVVRLWAPGGHLQGSLRTVQHSEIVGISLSPGGRLAAVLPQDLLTCNGQVDVFDLNSGKQSRSLRILPSESPAGASVPSTSSQRKRRNGIVATSFDPVFGSLLLAVAEDGSFRVWDTDARFPRLQWTHQNQANRSLPSPSPPSASVSEFDRLHLPVLSVSSGSEEHCGPSVSLLHQLRTGSDLSQTLTDAFPPYFAEDVSGDQAPLHEQLSEGPKSCPCSILSLHTLPSPTNSARTPVSLSSLAVAPSGGFAVIGDDAGVVRILQIIAPLPSPRLFPDQASADFDATMGARTSPRDVARNINPSRSKDLGSTTADLFTSTKFFPTYPDSSDLGTTSDAKMMDALLTPLSERFGVLETPHVLLEQPMHTGAVANVSFSPCGRFFFTSSMQAAEVRLWLIPSPHIEGTHPKADSEISSLKDWMVTQLDRDGVLGSAEAKSAVSLALPITETALLTCPYRAFDLSQREPSAAKGSGNTSTSEMVRNSENVESAPSPLSPLNVGLVIGGSGVRVLCSAFTSDSRYLVVSVYTALSTGDATLACKHSSDDRARLDSQLRDAVKALRSTSVSTYEGFDVKALVSEVTPILSPDSSENSAPLYHSVVVPSHEHTSTQSASAPLLHPTLGPSPVRLNIPAGSSSGTDTFSATTASNTMGGWNPSSMEARLARMWDAHLQVYDVHTGRLHRTIRHHAGPIMKIAPHPSSQLATTVLAVGGDGRAVVCDVESGEQRASFLVLEPHQFNDTNDPRFGSNGFQRAVVAAESNGDLPARESAVEDLVSGFGDAHQRSVLRNSIISVVNNGDNVPATLKHHVLPRSMVNHGLFAPNAHIPTSGLFSGLPLSTESKLDQVGESDMCINENLLMQPIPSLTHARLLDCCWVDEQPLTEGAPLAGLLGRSFGAHHNLASLSFCVLDSFGSLHTFSTRSPVSRTADQVLENPIDPLGLGVPPPEQYLGDDFVPISDGPSHTGLNMRTSRPAYERSRDIRLCDHRIMPLPHQPRRVLLRKLALSTLPRLQTDTTPNLNGVQSIAAYISQELSAERMALGGVTPEGVRGFAGLPPHLENAVSVLRFALGKADLSSSSLPPWVVAATSTTLGASPEDRKVTVHPHAHFWSTANHLDTDVMCGSDVLAVGALAAHAQLLPHLYYNGDAVSSFSRSIGALKDSSLDSLLWATAAPLHGLLQAQLRGVQQLRAGSFGPAAASAALVFHAAVAPPTGVSESSSPVGMGLFGRFLSQLQYLLKLVAQDQVSTDSFSLYSGIDLAFLQRSLDVSGGRQLGPLLFAARRGLRALNASGALSSSQQTLLRSIWLDLESSPLMKLSSEPVIPFGDWILILPIVGTMEASVSALSVEVLLRLLAAEVAYKKMLQNRFLEYWHRSGISAIDSAFKEAVALRSEIYGRFGQGSLDEIRPFVRYAGSVPSLLSLCTLFISLDHSLVHVHSATQDLPWKEDSFTLRRLHSIGSTGFVHAHWFLPEWIVQEYQLGAGAMDNYADSDDLLAAAAGPAVADPLANATGDGAPRADLTPLSPAPAAEESGELGRLMEETEIPPGTTVTRYTRDVFMQPVVLEEGFRRSMDPLTLPTGDWMSIFRLAEPSPAGDKEKKKKTETHTVTLDDGTFIPARVCAFCGKGEEPSRLPPQPPGPGASDEENAEFYSKMAEFDPFKGITGRLLPRPFYGLSKGGGRPAGPSARLNWVHVNCAVFAPLALCRDETLEWPPAVRNEREEIVRGGVQLDAPRRTLILDDGTALVMNSMPMKPLDPELIGRGAKSFARPIASNPVSVWYGIASELRRVQTDGSRCFLCDHDGASIGCLVERCQHVAHFECAARSGWTGWIEDDIRFGCDRVALQRSYDAIRLKERVMAPDSPFSQAFARVDSTLLGNGPSKKKKNRHFTYRQLNGGFYPFFCSDHIDSAFARQTMENGRAVSDEEDLKDDDLSDYTTYSDDLAPVPAIPVTTVAARRVLTNVSQPSTQQDRDRPLAPLPQSNSYSSTYEEPSTRLIDTRLGRRNLVIDSDDEIIASVNKKTTSSSTAAMEEYSRLEKRSNDSVSEKVVPSSAAATSFFVDSDVEIVDLHEATPTRQIEQISHHELSPISNRKPAPRIRASPSTRSSENEAAEMSGRRARPRVPILDYPSDPEMDYVDFVQQEQQHRQQQQEDDEVHGRTTRASRAALRASVREASEPQSQEPDSERPRRRSTLPPDTDSSSPFVVGSNAGTDEMDIEAIERRFAEHQERIKGEKRWRRGTHVERGWARGVQPQHLLYVPQVGDDVAFVPQGHKEYMRVHEARYKSLRQAVESKSNSVPARRSTRSTADVSQPPAPTATSTPPSTSSNDRLDDTENSPFERLAASCGASYADRDGVGLNGMDTTGAHSPSPLHSVGVDMIAGMNWPSSWKAVLARVVAIEWRFPAKDEREEFRCPDDFVTHDLEPLGADELDVTGDRYWSADEHSNSESEGSDAFDSPVSAADNVSPGTKDSLPGNSNNSHESKENVSLSNLASKKAPMNFFVSDDEEDEVRESVQRGAEESRRIRCTARLERVQRRFTLGSRRANPLAVLAKVPLNKFNTFAPNCVRDTLKAVDSRVSERFQGLSDRVLSQQSQENKMIVSLEPPDKPAFSVIARLRLRLLAVLDDIVLPDPSLQQHSGQENQGKIVWGPPRSGSKGRLLDIEDFSLPYHPGMATEVGEFLIPRARFEKSLVDMAFALRRIQAVASSPLPTAESKSSHSTDKAPLVFCRRSARYGAAMEALTSDLPRSLRPRTLFAPFEIFLQGWKAGAAQALLSRCWAVLKAFRDSALAPSKYDRMDADAARSIVHALANRLRLAMLGQPEGTSVIPAAAVATGPGAEATEYRYNTLGLLDHPVPDSGAEFWPRLSTELSGISISSAAIGARAHSILSATLALINKAEATDDSGSTTESTISKKESPMGKEAAKSTPRSVKKRKSPSKNESNLETSAHPVADQISQLNSQLSKILNASSLPSPLVSTDDLFVAAAEEFVGTHYPELFKAYCRSLPERPFDIPTSLHDVQKGHELVGAGWATRNPWKSSFGFGVWQSVPLPAPLRTLLLNIIYSNRSDDGKLTDVGFTLLQALEAGALPLIGHSQLENVEALTHNPSTFLKIPLPGSNGSKFLTMLRSPMPFTTSSQLSRMQQWNMYCLHLGRVLPTFNSAHISSNGEVSLMKIGIWKSIDMVFVSALTFAQEESPASWDKVNPPNPHDLVGSGSEVGSNTGVEEVEEEGDNEEDDDEDEDNAIAGSKRSKTSRGSKKKVKKSRVELEMGKVESRIRRFSSAARLLSGITVPDSRIIQKAVDFLATVTPEGVRNNEFDHIDDPFQSSPLQIHSLSPWEVDLDGCEYSSGPNSTSGQESSSGNIIIPTQELVDYNELRPFTNSFMTAYDDPALFRNAVARLGMNHHARLDRLSASLSKDSVTSFLALPSSEFLAPVVEPTPTDSLTPSRARFLINGLRSLISRKKIFKSLLRFDDHREMLLSVPLPLTLTHIISRLLSGYYRQLPSFGADILLLIANATIFMPGGMDEVNMKVFRNDLKALYDEAATI